MRGELQAMAASLPVPNVEENELNPEPVLKW
jgi:hypothetical protein